MPSPTHASPDDIDISQVFGAIRRNLLRLVFLSVLTGVLVYGIVSMVAPRYQSEAALEVVARDAANPFHSSRGAGSSPENVTVRMDKQAVNTHVRAIQSSEIAAAIAKKLNLNRLPEFNSAMGPVDSMDAVLRIAGIGGPRPGETEEDRVLNAFYKKLTVSSPPDSRIISIDFQSHDPDLAAEVANMLADTYRKRLASVTVVETGQLQKALEPKIEALTKEVAAAESAVSRYRAEAGLLEGGSQKTPLNDQQLGDLTTELTKVSAARSASDARARNARQLMNRGTPEIIPEVQRSPLVQNLIQQKVQVQRDLLKASASMKSAHPVIRQLDADLVAIRRQIAAEVANVVAGLEKEALVAAEQERSIRESLDKVKATVADGGEARAKLSQLVSLASSKRDELNRLQSQFEKNRGRADRGVIPVEARVITRARPSGVPIAPKKGAWTALAALAMFLVGLVCVITGALFSSARRPVAVTAYPAEMPARPVPQPSIPSPVQVSPQTHSAQTGRQLRSEPTLSAPADLARQAVAAAVGVERASAQTAAAADRDAASSATSQALTAQSDEAAALATPQFDGVTVKTPTALADHISEIKADVQGGFRTLLATSSTAPGRAQLVRDLALELNERDQTVMVVDWDLEGLGIAHDMNVANRPGFCEVLLGTASFSEVVKPIPGTRIHMIASGAAYSPRLDDPELDGLDPDQLNLILDALDEAYDQIIVVATKPQATVLFEIIQGRFDAGITVLDDANPMTSGLTAPGTFLGFDVTDIELVHYANQQAPADRSQNRRSLVSRTKKMAAPAVSSEKTGKRIAAVAGA
ncbi:MAG: exopolysaccharide transport family protein [Pseudomonadota bacterium]